MMAATSPGCAECADFPDDFVCSNWYTSGCEPILSDGVTDGTDDEPGLIDDITDLSEDNRVLWRDRSTLLIVDTGFGSHVIVEGPTGATYRISPLPNGGFQFVDWGGTVDNFRRVNPDPDNS